jgi:glycosyltransferase involved in cell wall biosynthesis
MADPRVTFVIPCFNHGRFVADAVVSCLRQSGCDARIVVVDDGSTDGSTPAACDACERLTGANGRVRVIHTPNQGLPAARNAGVAAARDNWGSGDAREDYYVFVDADDYLEPTFVATLHAALAGAGDDVSHAYCQERLVDLATGVWTVPEWDPLLMLITNLHPVTALVRRGHFEAVGGFDSSMRDGYEDWDLWLKFVGRSWRGVRVREPLFNWRRHSAVTMITDATARHGQLFRRLMTNHAPLYARHWQDLLARSNELLRRADANWLDENLDAIPIRDLRAWVKDLVPERDAARAHAAALAAERDALIAQIASVREQYERKPIVRLSRSVHALVDALPRPLARVLQRAKRAVVGGGSPAGRP